VTKQSNDETAQEETAVTADDDIEGTEPDETAGTELGEEKADELAENTDTPTEAESDQPKRRIGWSRVLALGVLPTLALLLALGAGFLKWQDNSVRDSQIARAQSVQAARDSTIALLSYKPDTVEQQLTAARDLLTGEFRGSYTSLTNDVVIPGAKQKRISAVATIPAAASVSAEPNHAVVLVFVNQTVIVGQDAPTDTASSVRVTLEKVGDRWLISKFDPV
jgi:Mce-associated membrane protein